MHSLIVVSIKSLIFLLLGYSGQTEFCSKILAKFKASS